VRRIAILAIALALCTLLGACGSSSSSPSSPKDVRASIVAAALAQQSVHWTESFSNIRSSRRSADVCAASAMEHVTIDMGGSPGKVKILRVGETEYEKGDVAGLEYDLGLSEAKATQYAGQWISIPNGDPAYTGYGLTVASVVHDALPHGRLKVSPRTSQGARLLAVQGKFSTLLAHAGSRLPVAYSGGAVDVWIKGRFSRWNEPLHIHAPASSTPIALVRASPKEALALILSTALAQKSVHMTATVGDDRMGATRYTVDIRGDYATERVEYHGSTMDVRLFNGALYLTGDALLLEERLGLTPAQAMRYAGRWISIPRTGDEPGTYAELTDGLTLASIVRRATRMKIVKVAHVASHGTELLVVRGTPAAPGIPVDEVKARANGTPLPVAFSGRLGRASVSGRFSKWNESLDVRAPRRSTPLTIVRGG
jgi:hypothetical protein